MYLPLSRNEGKKQPSPLRWLPLAGCLITFASVLLYLDTFVVEFTIMKIEKFGNVGAQKVHQVEEEESFQFSVDINEPIFQENVYEREELPNAFTQNEFKCERTTGEEFHDLDFSNSSDKKYFLYSPSGGFSNQRAELEYGLLIARELNRTLIIPMAGKHTTWWTNYAALGYEELVPMDMVFDLRKISKSFSFVVTNKTINDVEALIYEHSGDQSHMIKLIKPKHRPRWRGKAEILENLGGFDDKYLFLKGSTMYHHWYGKNKRASVTKLLPFNPCIKSYALDLAAKMGGSYNSLHIRLGDYYKFGRAPSVYKLIKKMLEMGYDFDTPLYIATEPQRVKRFFAPLERKFKNIVYSSNFTYIRKDLKQQFEKPIIDDVLGMIEQLICLGAKRFVGTDYSNFSRYINTMRNYTSDLFPEAELNIS